ncbi:TIGR03620 family F420-dependent LLM class oxidoreductase [Actinomadura sp. DC4]|uniref:TIGR03620 family F420-dependent LLM class oxidoreductase n=1 Tax=Actinomadura sp. DC4 TaxID=3055069 RepID=UPI0025B25549|nr:TIGR03620 family F420-dependent LLM class oxidoreductase [Actinomadura sp. DC4]MDN3352992.1 TIGR03620 family F420-dependent LLM class oxidoreductase [Actinomadura sp. DC4]
MAQRTPPAPSDLAAVKHRLGRVGVWFISASAASAEVERPAVVAIEQFGYSAFWFGENPSSKEAFTHAAALLSWTEHMQVASGIANIWGRDASAAANGAATLADTWGNRFVLGLGVSHAPLVDTRGHDYGKPLAVMRSYLEAMDTVPFALPLAEAPPRLIAALRPKMLELSKTHAQGAHTYFTTPEHTRRARDILGDEPVLAVEQAVVLDTDEGSARAAAREYADRYLKLPNYQNHLRELGFTDDDLKGSDALVDAVVAWGDPDAIAERVRAHHDAGADHVCVQTIAPTIEQQTEHLRELAPALTG